MLPRDEHESLLARVASQNREIKLRAIHEAGALSYDGYPLADALMHRLLEEDKEVATAAEDALVRIGPGSLPAIARYFFDPESKWQVVAVMERLVKETLERLKRLRTGATREVGARIDAVLSLAVSAIPELLQASTRGSSELMPIALAALSRLGAPAVPVLLAEVKADKYDDAKTNTDQWRLSHPAALPAVACLARIGLPAKDAMLEILRSRSHPRLRGDCEHGLAALGDEITAELRIMLRSAEPHQVHSALHVFGHMQLGGISAIKDLFACFKSPDEDIRALAGETVVHLLDIMEATAKHYGIEDIYIYLPDDAEILAVAEQVEGRKPTQGLISPDGEMGAATACAALLVSYCKQNPEKRRVAARVILRLLKRTDTRHERMFLLRQFCRLGSVARKRLAKFARSADVHTRELAAQGFVYLHPTRAARAMPTLVALLADTSPDIQTVAARVLWRIKRKSDAAVALNYLPPLRMIAEILPRLMTYEQWDEQLGIRGTNCPSPLRVGLWLLGLAAHRAERADCEAAHRALALLAMTVSTEEPVGIDAALEMLESRLRE